MSAATTTPGVGGPPNSGARATAKASLPTAGFMSGGTCPCSADGKTQSTIVSAGTSGKAGNRALLQFGAGGGSPSPAYVRLGAHPASDPQHWASSPNSPPVPLGSAALFGTAVSAPWTEEDISILRRVWRDPEILKEQLPTILGRTIHAIDSKACILRLGKRPLAARKPRVAPSKPRATKHWREWKDEEVATLREGWGVLPMWELAAKVGRTISGCEKKAHSLKLPYRSKSHVQFVQAPPTTPRQAGPAIHRKCLCCRVEFDAPTRFIRLCSPCQRRSVGMD